MPKTKKKLLTRKKKTTIYIHYQELDYLDELLRKIEDESLDWRDRIKLIGEFVKSAEEHS